METDNLFEVFDDYVSNFDLENDKLKYKYMHSYRVTKECENIAKYINFDEDGIYLACLIGLFHDVSKFEQYIKNNFNNNNHGEYSVKILFEEGLINKTEAIEEEYDVIKKSIINHNKYEIDKTIVDECELLYCQLLRDADKLDIFYAFANELLELKDNDKNISEEVKKEFFNHKLINENITKTDIDQIIKLFSYVFDLHFGYSKNKILNEKYIDKIYKSLNLDILKEYYDEVINYLKEE